MKEAEKLGGGIMKEVGDLFDKTSRDKKIKPQKKGQRFLVCDACGVLHHRFRLNISGINLMSYFYKLITSFTLN